MSELRAQAAVIGAGAFGGWTALHLQEKGLDTILVDAWGSGHGRASSGGESRIIRCAYGDRRIYTGWAQRAMQEWDRRQSEWGRRLFSPCGILWVGTEGEPHIVHSRQALAELGIPFRDLSRKEIDGALPGFRSNKGEIALLETAAGAIRARRACRLVVGAFCRAGGRFEIGQIQAPNEQRDDIEALALSDGRRLRAEFYLFACGPWLPALFPAALGRRIRSTRQEVFFFGPPAHRCAPPSSGMSAWFDFNGGDFYGIPPFDGRGLKLACDRLGEEFDPTRGDRLASLKGFRKARRYLSRRLPEWREAPLLESRVCQYEATPDRHLIIDRHPRLRNVWIAGGGSGHGFKLGPIVGKLCAEMLCESRVAPSEVLLSRFSGDRGNTDR